MPRLDELPADQKAVLQLLLKQNKTYDDIAGLLRLDADAVRERALDALDAIGPQTLTGLDGDDQDEIADYLLSQQTVSGREATRDLLESSAPGRAWARVVAAELRPLAPKALPEIPAEGAEVEQAFDALAQRQDAEERQERSSRLGGILILAAIGIVIVLGIVLVVGGKDDDDKDDSPAVSQDAGTGATAEPGATGGTGTTESPANFRQQQVNLDPPTPKKGVGGLAQVAGDALVVAAQGLPQDKTYLVWLYNSEQDARPLGFIEYQKKDKRYAGGVSGIPASLEKYKYIVITSESAQASADPSTVDAVPDTIVLKSTAIKK